MLSKLLRFFLVGSNNRPKKKSFFEEVKVMILDEQALASKSILLFCNAEWHTYGASAVVSRRYPKDWHLEILSPEFILKDHDPLTLVYLIKDGALMLQRSIDIAEIQFSFDKAILKTDLTSLDQWEVEGQKTKIWDEFHKQSDNFTLHFKGKELYLDDIECYEVQREDGETQFFFYFEFVDDGFNTTLHLTTNPKGQLWVIESTDIDQGKARIVTRGPSKVSA